MNRLSEKQKRVFRSTVNFYIQYCNFKINRGISSSTMKNILEPRTECHYNLRCISPFYKPLVNTVFQGTRSIPFLGPKIWSLLPETFKNIDYLENFKISIKKWKPENCKVYIKMCAF